MEVICVIIGGIIGGIIGFASSYFMWNVQTRYERKNVARALYMEISSLEGRLKAYTEAFKKPPPGCNPEDPVKITQPLYTEELLFSSFRKEISSFNKELSNTLFQFYIHLLEAEKLRQIDKKDMFAIQLNKIMKDQIVEAYRLLPDLKKLLEKE